METQGIRTTTSGRPGPRWSPFRPFAGRVRGTFALLSVALLALLLASCSGDGGEDGQEEDEGTIAPTATAASTDTGTPAGGNGEEGRVAQTGDTVSLHYRGTLDDGSEFDSSAGRDPLTFTVGAGQVIAGFDEAVKGMAVGEKKTFRLEPEEAYGERSEDLIITVPAENAPEGLQPGQQVALGNAPATVVSIGENGDVVVDANHALAGQALTFDVELVSIE